MYKDHDVKPAVSVIIATYNQAEYLPRALQSLFDQTLARAAYEMIIVDDGSTDDTTRVLERYSDYLTVIRHGANRGLIQSCNEGISTARGRYFVRVDSDDWIDPELLRKEKQLLDDNRDACCVYSDRYEFSENKQRLVRVRDGNLYGLVACGTMFRTQTVRAIGGYRPLFWEEYDLYLRLKDRGDFLYLQEPLYHYWCHPQSMTANASRRIEGWKQLVELWGEETLIRSGSHPELSRVLSELHRVQD